MSIPVGMFQGTPITYATWNPLDKASGITLSTDLLSVTASTGNSTVRSTIGKSTGKWYWEITVNSQMNMVLGIALATAPLNQFLGADITGYSWGYLGGTSSGYYIFMGAFDGGYLPYTNTYIIGFELNMNSGTLIVNVNNIYSGLTITGLAGTIYPAFSTAGGGDEATANFGASPFVYAVPAGYNAGLY